MKRILISGVTGFLGSSLARAFLDSGYRVYGIKRRTSKLNRIIDIIDDIKLIDSDDIKLDESVQLIKPEIVIHTACDYGRNNKGVISLLETNLIFSINLLEASKKSKVNCFINTDSSLDKNVNAYSLSKSQFKEWGRYYSSEMRFLNLRIEHMYGVGDDNYKFIHWFVGQLKTSEVAIKLTSGIQLRDFIYIEDVVSAYLLIVKKYADFSMFFEIDIATGELVPVRDFLNEIVGVFKAKTISSCPELEYGAIPFRENEMMAAKVSPKILHKLGWTAKISRAEGISRILEDIG